MRCTAVILALCLVGVGGCSRRQRVEAEMGLADLLISERQEADIGRQLEKELRVEGVRYVKDPVVVRYVEHIGEKIFKRVRKAGYDGELHLHVIDDPTVVNAFAAPGGHLFVYSGLLLAAETEAEVAGVVGHEAGHIAGRHAARQMLYAYGYGALASWALGENPSLVKQVAATVIGQGFLARHSQAEEYEADRRGVRYMAQAGWDPEGMVTFFETLEREQGHVPGVIAWFSSHPPPADRVEELQRVIRKRDLEGGRQGRDAHLEAIRALEEPPSRKRKTGS